MKDFNLVAAASLTVVTASMVAFAQFCSNTGKENADTSIQINNPPQLGGSMQVQDTTELPPDSSQLQPAVKNKNAGMKLGQAY